MLLALQEDCFGRNHHVVGCTLSCLGRGSCCHLGEAWRDRDLLEKALCIQERVYGRWRSPSYSFSVNREPFKDVRKYSRYYCEDDEVAAVACDTMVLDELQWSKDSSAKCAAVHIKFNQTKAQGAGAHPTGYSCTSERRPQLCRTCRRLPPPCAVMKMILFTPALLVHTPFRLQRVRGWLTSSMYLVFTVCVDMCGGSFDMKPIQLS